MVALILAIGFEAKWLTGCHELRTWPAHGLTGVDGSACDVISLIAMRPYAT